MPHTRPSRFPLVALAVLAAACSDSTTQPKTTPADLTAVLSEMSVSGLVPSTVGSLAGPLSTGTLVPSQCAYDGSSQFVCAPVSFRGLVTNRSFTLLSESGASQAAFDATTAAVRTVSTTTGTLSLDGTPPITVDERSTMTLSGLIAGPHRLDGTDVTTLTSGRAGTLGSLNMTVTTTIVGLEPPNFKSGGKYPRAGTITTVLTDASFPGSDSGFSTTMTFNGTSIVDVTMTMGGRTTHCTLDLASSGSPGSSCFQGLF